MSQRACNSSSQNDKDDRLVRWTRQPCRSVDALHDVCTALMQQRHKRRQGATDWQLSRSAIAVLHEVLSHIAALDELMPGLLDLLACALRVSPLGEAAPLAKAVATCDVPGFCRTLTQCAQRDIQQEHKEEEEQQQCVTEATEVLLSIVGAYHALLAAHRTLSVADYLAHATQLEASLVLLLQRQTPCAGTVAVCEGVAQAWLSTVLRYARSHPPSAYAVVTYLMQGIDLNEGWDEARDDDEHGVSAQLLHPLVRHGLHRKSNEEGNGGGGVVGRQWKAVWELLLLHTLRQRLREDVQEVRNTWQSAVKPVLLRWLTHCPLSLTESFAQPPYIMSSRDTAEEDVTSVISHDVQTLLAHALHKDITALRDAVHELCVLYKLARTLATLTDHTITLYVPSQDTCAHTLLPAVHCALLERRLREAIVLLQWCLHAPTAELTAALRERLTQWLRRLRCAQHHQQGAECIPCELPQCPRQSVAGKVYREVLAHSEGVATLAVPAVLDLLVHATTTTTASQASAHDSRAVHVMRVVCDVALRVGQGHSAHDAWGRAVLQDGFALPFLLSALTQIAQHALVHDGDMAAARMYYGWLGQCLLRCPSRIALYDFGVTLTGSIACRLQHQEEGGGEEGGCCCGLSCVECAVWAKMARAITDYTRQEKKEMREADEDSVCTRVKPHIGAAFHARRAFFDRLCTAAETESNDSNSNTMAVPPACTTITVRGEGTRTAASATDRVVLVRQRHGEAAHDERALRDADTSNNDDVAALWPPAEMSIVCRATCRSLQSLVTSMQAIAEANREQLRQGGGGGGGSSSGVCLGTRTALADMPAPHSRNYVRHNNSDEHGDDGDGGGGGGVCEGQPHLSLKERLSHTNGETKTNSNKGADEARREAWWAARCALDRRVAHLVCVLEHELGPWRVALLGELALPLRLTLWQCSRRLMCDIHAIVQDSRTEYDDKGEKDVCTMEQCYVLLHGLPYVALHSVSPDMSDVHAMEEDRVAAWASQPCAAHSAAVRYCAAVDACASCAALVQRTAATLAALVVNQACDATSAQGTAVREAVMQRCSHAVRDVFDTFYDTLHADYMVSAPIQDHTRCRDEVRDVHLDLLQLPREHVYLVLGESSWHALPWEGIDVLCRHSISRVPSADYVTHTLAQQYSTSHTACVLDTARVLLYIDPSATAQRPKYERLLRAHADWSAEYGPSSSAAQQQQPPPPQLQTCTAFVCSDDEEVSKGRTELTLPAESPLLRRMLCEQRGLLVYVGHRRGEELVSRAQLYERVPLYPSDTAGTTQGDVLHCQPHTTHFPSVMLMSCSSAQTLGNAYCEPYGMPLAYLHAGAAFFLGCLWHVTDRDTDRLTRAFLRILCGPSRTQTKDSDEQHTKSTTDDDAAAEKKEHTRCVVSVGEALARARRACRLRYLSGLASVMYGVNVCVER